MIPTVASYTVKVNVVKIITAIILRSIKIKIRTVRKSLKASVTVVTSMVTNALNATSGGKTHNDNQTVLAKESHAFTAVECLITTNWNDVWRIVVRAIT